MFSVGIQPYNKERREGRVVVLLYFIKHSSLPFFLTIHILFTDQSKTQHETFVIEETPVLPVAEGFICFLFHKSS